MSAVHRIFFDTNPLHQSWPDVSVKVENILAAARKLGIPVEIPEPVMMELERKWTKDTKAKLQSTSSVIRELFGFVGESDPIPNLPSWDSFHDAYVRHVSDVVSQWGIEITPMPIDALGDVFKHAVHEELLFGDEGRHFKDVVILLAVVERMRERIWEIGVIVTDDSQFSKRDKEIARYCSDVKAQLTSWTVADAWLHLSEVLGEVTKERLARHKELARAAVTAALPMIQDVLNNALAHRASMGWLRTHFPEIERDAHFDEVVDVDVPVLENEPQLDDVIRISAHLKGTVHVDRMGDTSQISQVPLARRTINWRGSLRGKFDGTSYTIIPGMNFAY
jgi:hypothetical protein